MKNLFYVGPFDCNDGYINIHRTNKNIRLNKTDIKKGDWVGSITIQETPTSRKEVYTITITHNELLETIFEGRWEVNGLYIDPLTARFKPCKISLIAQLSNHMIARYKKRAYKKVSVNEDTYRFDKISNMNEQSCSFINTLSIIGYMYNSIPSHYIDNKDWWER